MKVAYISGPYRAPTPWRIQNNIRKASTIALQYWKEGYAVICPHANTALFDGEAPDSIWLEGDQELLRRSDVVVMVPYWWSSVGAQAEHALAVELGKEIIYEEDDMF